ncbi:MAG: TonB-dependent receptor [Caulobacterales bacterium]|nr:TonB-dependent receptor [Caulobacterales bacterium]
MSAASAGALASAHPALAQDAAGEEAGEAEVIVVTGFRQSLADALSNKRNSNQIIESVSAEDIGKFPDQNIAESLQRLPGIQIDRENGQGTKVRIRGLDQNITVLNGETFLTGLELFSLGEGADRQTDSLEGIPAELLGGVDVYKSPNASIVEGGLGGLIDLKTRSGLDFDEGFSAAGNLRASANSDADGWDPVGAGFFSYNMNDRLGIVGAISYDKQNIRTAVLGGDNRGNWRFADNGSDASFYAPEFRYLTDRDQDRERLGGLLGVEFAMTDAITLKGEWFHSELDIDNKEIGAKFPFTAGSEGVLDTSQPFEIDSNGVLQSGTINASSMEVISIGEQGSSEADNIQLGFDYDAGGEWSGGAQFSFSDARQEKVQGHNDVRYTQYSVPTADPTSPTGFSHQPANPGAPSGFSFLYDNGDGELPSLSFVGTPDLLTNPDFGFFKSHWVFGNETDVQNWSLRGDVQYRPDYVPGQNLVVSGGFRYAERDVEFTQSRLLADYSGKGELNGLDFGANWTPFGYFQDGAIGFKSCELPAEVAPAGCDNRFGNSPPLITPFVTFSGADGRLVLVDDFFGAGDGAAPSASVLTQDPQQIVNDPVGWISALYPDTPFSFFEDPLNSFQVEEETISGYLMFDLGGDGDRYHVNAGVRLIDTTLTVTQGAAPADPTFWGTDSWNGVLRDADTIVTERSYTDILPSANVVLDVTDEQKVRVSMSRVVARQNLFDLGRGFQTDFTRVEDPESPDFNLFQFTNGSRGNPELDPFRANQVDVAWEYYFGSQGFAGVTGYWKEVDSFILEQSQSVFVADQTQDGGTVGSVLQPVNGDGGRIRGFELAGQYAFDWGGGFTANYTYSDSETTVFTDFDTDLPIPGVAEHAYNIQGYYDNHGVEVRLSWSWRDESFDRIFSFTDSSQADGVVTGAVINRPFGQLNGQIVYHVNDMFDLTAEAVNITKEDQTQYFQFEDLPFRSTSGSRRILVGGRFRY